MTKNLTGKIGFVVGRFEAGGPPDRIPAIVLQHGERDLLLMTRRQDLPHIRLDAEDCAHQRMPYFEADENADIGHLRSVIDAREQMLAGQKTKAAEEKAAAEKAAAEKKAAEEKAAARK